jgi:hypothetical protein
VPHEEEAEVCGPPPLSWTPENVGAQLKPRKSGQPERRLNRSSPPGPPRSSRASWWRRPLGGGRGRVTAR